MLQYLAFARSRIHTEIDSMTGAPEQGTSFDCLQDTLQIAHRGRIFDLTVSHREGGVDLAGDAVSYHAVQLVIRDVHAAGVRIRRNHIRVRPLARS